MKAASTLALLGYLTLAATSVVLAGAVDHERVRKALINQDARATLAGNSAPGTNIMGMVEPVPAPGSNDDEKASAWEQGVQVPPTSTAPSSDAAPPRKQGATDGLLTRVWKGVISKPAELFRYLREHLGSSPDQAARAPQSDRKSSAGKEHDSTPTIGVEDLEAMFTDLEDQGLFPGLFKEGAVKFLKMCSQTKKPTPEAERFIHAAVVFGAAMRTVKRMTNGTGVDAIRDAKTGYSVALHLQAAVAGLTVMGQQLLKNKEPAGKARLYAEAAARTILQFGVDQGSRLLARFQGMVATARGASSAAAQDLKSRDCHISRYLEGIHRLIASEDRLVDARFGNYSELAASTLGHGDNVTFHAFTVLEKLGRAFNRLAKLTAPCTDAPRSFDAVCTDAGLK